MRRICTRGAISARINTALRRFPPFVDNLPIIQPPLPPRPFRASHRLEGGVEAVEEAEGAGRVDVPEEGEEDLAAGVGGRWGVRGGWGRDSSDISTPTGHRRDLLTDGSPVSLSMQSRERLASDLKAAL